MESLHMKKVHTGQLPLDPFYIGLISAKYAGKGVIQGLLNGLKSYLHGRKNKEAGSTLLTVWMKK